MTTRPQFRLRGQIWPGMAAIVLFIGFVIAIFQPSIEEPITESFGTGVGFPEGESIIANIGFALLHIDAGAIEVESFLVALILIAIVLDAALSGAVLLATRDDPGGVR